MVRDHTIVIVIPARFASTRFPGKPLADIGGKPMIQHVWERCSKSRLASRVIVATDDTRIADTVACFGGEALITPSNLASGTERVAFVARSIEADFIVNVQGDEPLIEPALIDATVSPLLQHRDRDIGTAATPITSLSDMANPNIVKVVVAHDGRALYFSRSPIPFTDVGEPVTENFLRHVGLYAFPREVLLRWHTLPASPLEALERLEQLRPLQSGLHIHVEIVNSQPRPSVDVPEDIPAVLDFLKKEQ